MNKIKLGNSDLMVSRMGLGTMGMSEFYGSTDDNASISVIHNAIDLGINFFDTADMYGTGHNEELLGKAIKDTRQHLIIATKFGILRGPEGEFLGVSNKPEYIKQAVDASLKRLGIDVIDLYYMHRRDPEVPVEDSVGTMADLVKKGKVRYLGLSEVSADTLKKANAIHPITAVQSEYSLWSTDIEYEVIPVCRSMGISLVAYSPLGRGFLTGQIKKFDDLPEDDYRRNSPRFIGDNFDKNMDIVREVEKIAKANNAAPGQVALAWLMAKGDLIVPIPGTKRDKYLRENIGSMELSLSSQDITKLDDLSRIVTGDRYPEYGMKMIYG